MTDSDVSIVGNNMFFKKISNKHSEALRHGYRERIEDMKNEVRATGVLIRTGRGSYGYPEAVVLIKIKGRDDIYIHFQLECELDADIVRGTTVDVEGCVRGYYSKAGNSWEVTQYMAARKITRTKSVLEKEMGVKGHFTEKHDIRILLEGEVQFTASYNDPYQAIKIDVTGENRKESISLDVKRSPRLPDVTRYSKGDKVAIYATVFAKSKEINGEKRFFENLAVQDIALISKAKKTEEWNVRQFEEEARRYSNRSVMDTVLEGI